MQNAPGKLTGAVAELRLMRSVNARALHEVMKWLCLAPALAVIPAHAAAQHTRARSPVIDVHLHALPANWFGPPPATICIGQTEFLAMDPRDGPQHLVRCPAPAASLLSDDELMRATLRELERYNVVMAIASGPADVAERWHARAPARIVSGIFFADYRIISVDSLRALHRAGKLDAFAEVATEYSGLSPSDPELEPYFALAEELDIPVGVHMGLGAPGEPYVGNPRYRARLSDPRLLEEMLLRHPKLRVWVAHAGWPMLDEMIAVLYAHPQVYVDLGVIDYFVPKPEFYYYLRRLVEAGFGDRIMYGSDQMLWPEAIGYSIEAIETADFLTERQKRSILHDNAARFLRLDRDVFTNLRH